MTLTWSHATNSSERVKTAVDDPRITAIECDVMLGVANEGGTKFYETPILAHPPHRESDISVATLLIRATKKDNGVRVIQKHLKLDFKEIEALKPTLEILEMSKLANPLGKTIFLNADVLPGPGRREDPHVPPIEFLETCLAHIRSYKDRDIFYAFSLGYKCEWSSGQPYQNEDVMLMAEIANEYKLNSDSGIGLVLALNARLLSNKPDVFDGFLRQFPRSVILAWTGSGEPSIPAVLIDKICAHFTVEGMRERIDFDCLVLRDEEPVGRSTDPPTKGSNELSSIFLWIFSALVTGVAIGVALGRKL